ncbi:MAG: malate dehydrogenase [Candidatus Omnitrophota bacterium]
MKITVIGAGDVGAAVAQRVAEAGLADVALLDIVAGRAEARALDLSSAAAITRQPFSLTGTTEYKDIAGSDIVVITAGMVRKPGQSREELLLSNAGIIKSVSQKIAEYCPEAIIIVVTNPLDAMTYLVYKTTGFSSQRIIGMGGVSDCARFSMLAATELNTAASDIHTLIMGAHSDSMVVLPRFTTVKGIPLRDLLPEGKIEQIVKDTCNFGAKIVHLLGAKGSASFGPSAGVYALIEAIARNRRSILCVSGYLNGQYTLTNICAGVPAKIGRKGIEEIIELDLESSEKAQLLSSAEEIKKLIQKLGV